MARFDRYMLSQLMVLFGFFALVLVLIYWINRAVLLFEQLIGDGQTALVFLEFTALSLPGVIRIVLPIAAVAASIYVTNRMASESELTVVQATGFSPQRLVRPVIVFGLIVTLLMSILSHFLVPMASTSYSQRSFEVSQNISARFLNEGEFMTPAPGVTLYIRNISPQGELNDLFLSDTRSTSESLVYTAARAFIIRTDAGPQLVMIDGMAQAMRNDSQRLIVTRFDDFAYDLTDLIQAAAPRGRSATELWTWEQLWPDQSVLEESRADADRLWALAHDRFGQSLLSVVAALLGFSTLIAGSFSRFGVWRQIVTAIFLVIGVKMVETACTNAIRSDSGLWALIYLPSVVGLIVVWFQLFHASRPDFFRHRHRVEVAP